MKKSLVMFFALALMFSILFASAGFIYETAPEKPSLNLIGKLPTKPIILPEIPQIPGNEKKSFKNLIFPSKSAEQSKMNAEISCIDSDVGENIYVKGTMTYGDNDGYTTRYETCNYNDAVSPNTRVNELHCGMNPYFHNNNWIPCPFGCEDGACVYAEISVATMKDWYRPGEIIRLTDPPEAEVIKLSEKKEKKSLKDELENPGLESNQKSNGYIVEFYGNPVIVEKVKLEKDAEESGRQININSELKKYSEELQEKNEKVKKRIALELKGNKEKSFYKEFNMALNGIVVKWISYEEAKKIEKIKGVKRVSYNNDVQAMLMDSIPLINADDVWMMKDNDGEFLTGKGILIGILDTGIDYHHVDLGGCAGPACKVIGGYNTLDQNNLWVDGHGHGTHVSATAAGNGILRGVAPDAKLYSMKVLDNGGWGTWDSVVEGIERSADLDWDGIPMEDGDDYADVISLSLGGGGNPDDAASTAIDNVVNAGIVAVIAAGNWGPGPQTIASPGMARKAITVGATDKDDVLAWFSSRGPVIWQNEIIMKPDLVAPGVDICAAQWQDAWLINQCLDTEHTKISGTSMATPHVSGAAALLLQRNPELNPDEVKEILKNSAYSLPYSEPEVGKGRLDILSAIKLGSRPQSKIVNDGNVDITGDLVMILQKKSQVVGEKTIPLSETWVNEQIVTNEQVTVPAKGLVKLDVGGSYGWNLKNVKANSEGDYRVYASFGTDLGKIEATWEFMVSNSAPNDGRPIGN